MKKSQLENSIQEKFEIEQKNIHESPIEKKKGKTLRIILSMIMSSVIIGSLIYSLLDVLPK